MADSMQHLLCMPQHINYDMVKPLNKDTHGMKTPPLLGSHNYDCIYSYIYLYGIYLAQNCMGGFGGGGWRFLGLYPPPNGITN